MSDFLEQVKQIPIVNVLQDIYGVELTKHGERYSCKIRNERTSSCYIYPTNSFYDFGGGVGGDVIKLVEVMDGCSSKSAIEKLSNYAGIEREKVKRNNKELFDYEWRQLGVEYPEMVSKNMRINVLQDETEKPRSDVDINLYLNSPQQIRLFEEKYQTHINDFRKKDKVGYHNFLRNILRELSYDKDLYLSSLHSNYRLCLEIGGPAFAKKTVSNDPEFKEMAKEINKRSRLLRQAVDDFSLLKTPLFSLEPSKDLEDILSGKVAVLESNINYYELCKLAKDSGEQLSVFQVEYCDYVHETTKYTSPTHNFPHSCYFKNGKCYVTTATKNIKEYAKLFGNEIKNTALTITDFMKQQKEKTKSI